MCAGECDGCCTADAPPPLLPPQPPALPPAVNLAADERRAFSLLVSRISLGSLSGAVGVFMTVGAAILCRRQVVSALARAREEKLLREAEEAAAGTELTVPSHRSDV